MHLAKLAMPFARVQFEGFIASSAILRPWYWVEKSVASLRRAV